MASFDLKAATEAARTEAAGTPFEFDWGDEHFEIPAMADWPLEISAGFAEFIDTDDVPPAKMFALFEMLVGPDDWDRFAATVPLDALTVLIEQMSQQQVGASMPDLSQPAELASTLT